jgi:hypothetical protein
MSIDHGCFKRDGTTFQLVPILSEGRRMPWEGSAREENIRYLGKLVVNKIMVSVS